MRSLYTHMEINCTGVIIRPDDRFFALLAGLITNGAMPGQSTIDTIELLSAVMGALIVFPVYFIGKELINEKAGLIGAFMIAILPGQFLSRSVLGHR